MVIVAVLVGAPVIVIAHSMWRIYQPAPRKRPVPILDDSKVEYFAHASRELSCGLVKFDETGQQTASIEFDRGEHDFERLMLTLLPVRDEKTLALQKSYMVWVFVGNRGGPDICVGFAPHDDGEGELVVKYHGRYYSGGNAAEFKAIVEALLQRSE